LILVSPKFTQSVTKSDFGGKHAPGEATPTPPTLRYQRYRK